MIGKSPLLFIANKYQFDSVFKHTNMLILNITEQANFPLILKKIDHFHIFPPIMCCEIVFIAFSECCFDNATPTPITAHLLVQSVLEHSLFCVWSRTVALVGWFEKNGNVQLCTHGVSLSYRNYTELLVKVIIL